MPAVVYATAADLTAYLGATGATIVSDRDGSGSADTGVQDTALAGASSTADSYLAQWLPLPEVPLALRECVLAIATYRLANNMETDDQRRRYEDAIQWLRDVAKGIASLGIPPAVEDPSASVGVVSFAYQDRQLTRSTLRGCL
jgi:phage gp36-like protein